MPDRSYLDPDQFMAVTAPDGNVAVVAGAGTGKTFTIVERVAYLITEKNIPADEIVVVTFTNKAATEIKQRVMDKVGPQAMLIRMGTFHSLSLRILRKYAEMTGLQSSRFTIADDDDTRKLLDMALEAADVFPAFEEPRSQFDVRFYLVAILFIIFDLEAAFLFPWAVSLDFTGWSGWATMMIFIGELAIGLIYAWKVGALEWE